MNEMDKEREQGNPTEKPSSPEGASDASEDTSGVSAESAVEVRSDKDRPAAKDTDDKAEGASASSREAEQANNTSSVESVAATAQAAGDVALKAIGAVGKTASELGGNVIQTAQRYETQTAAGKLADESHMRLAHLTYLLFALGPVTGVSSLFGLVISYLRLREADIAGTLLESHFRWLIRTFWLGVGAILGSAILAGVLGPVIGGLAFLATLVWYVYRVAKGWLALYDEKQISDPRTWL
jgi:uncharacterized membrane protein